MPLHLRDEIAEVLRQLKDVQGQQLQLSQAFGRVMAEQEQANDLTLEKLKLTERVTSLDQQIRHLIELKTRDHADMKELTRINQVLLEKISVAVYGNGQPGLRQQVHDLQAMFAIGKWVIITGGAIVLMQFVQFLLEAFRGKGL